MSLDPKMKMKIAQLDFLYGLRMSSLTTFIFKKSGTRVVFRRDIRKVNQVTFPFIVEFRPTAYN